MQVAGVSSFSLLCSLPLDKYATTHFIHSPVEGHSDYFQFEIIRDSVAVNILSCLSVLIFIPPLNLFSSKELLNHKMRICSTLENTLKHCFGVLVSI